MQLISFNRNRHLMRPPSRNVLVGLGCLLLISGIYQPLIATDKALQHYQKGQYPEALRQYERALQARPDWDEAHFGKGAALYKAGRIEEALRAFEQALAIRDPRRKAAVYYNIGNGLFQSGRVTESLPFYKRALELDPRDFDAKHNYELARRTAQQSSKEQQSSNQSQQKDQQQSNQKQQSSGSQKSEEQQQSAAQARQQQQKRQAQAKAREEAAQVLDALQRDEQRRLQERQRVPAGGFSKEKDW